MYDTFLLISFFFLLSFPLPPAPLLSLQLCSLGLSVQSDSRQTPPYSPQPTLFSQGSSQSSSSPQSSSSSKTSAGVGPPKQSQQPQVPLSLFGFPPSHPGQYHHSAALTALGLLPSHHNQHQSHQSQGHQVHHQHHHPSNSWPIHGPILQTSSGPGGPSPPGLKFPLRQAPGPGNGNTGPGGSLGGGSPSPINLNDPSIIFAQPAGRPMGLGGGQGRDRHWHNHLAQQGAMVANGTVGKSGTHWVAPSLSVSSSCRNSQSLLVCLTNWSDFVLVFSSNCLFPC